MVDEKDKPKPAPAPAPGKPQGGTLGLPPKAAAPQQAQPAPQPAPPPAKPSPPVLPQQPAPQPPPAPQQKPPQPPQVQEQALKPPSAKGIREQDLEEFEKLIRLVVGPLPGPKQAEFDKLFRGFNDYAFGSGARFSL